MEGFSRLTCRNIVTCRNEVTPSDTIKAFLADILSSIPGREAR